MEFNYNVRAPGAALHARQASTLSRMLAEHSLMVVVKETIGDLGDVREGKRPFDGSLLNEDEKMHLAAALGLSRGDMELKTQKLMDAIHDRLHAQRGMRHLSDEDAFKRINDESLEELSYAIHNCLIEQKLWTAHRVDGYDPYVFAIENCMGQQHYLLESGHSLLGRA